MSTVKRRLFSRLECNGEELPREFRIFASGVNDSANGPVVFDMEAAYAVMETYRTHGAQLFMDREHLSLEKASSSVNFDTDAMAWFDIELRGDTASPELWAVNVTWTPEGERRLREKRQRYMSPAFWTDERGHVTELVNVALTSLPATHGLDALVEARQDLGKRAPKKRNAMDPESMDVAKIAEGMGLDLKGLAKALNLEPGATMEDITAALQVVGDKLGKIVGLGPAPAPAEEEPAAEPAPEANAAAPVEDENELKASRMVLLRSTSARSMSQALDVVETWRRAFVAQEAERVKLAKERASIEAAERRSIGATLVGAGLSPAMVWADPLARTLTLAPVLQGQSIEELRAYSQKAGPNRPPPAPPVAGGAAGLTDREAELCKRKGITPEAFLATRSRLRVTTGRSGGMNNG